MPTYQYRCTACGNDLEAAQKFTDPALTTCPECSGTLRKVFNTVGVVFKGSGFYATDSRKASSASKPAAPAKSDTTPSAPPASAPANGSTTAAA